MDTVLLSRIQFAVTTMFHILFPTLTIGLSLFLVVIEFLWLRTKKELYYRMYRYWSRFFAVNFAVGVVTGIVLEFEFGTNFSVFSQKVSNVISPLLAFEVMTAFFLESGFLGIMLFGWNRVSRGIHFLSTCLVAAGTVVSAFWILAANSWMQTPAGYGFAEGTFLATDFVAVLFNPSALVRMAHMTMASLETSIFVTAGISAYYLLKGRSVALFARCMGISLAIAAIVAPLQLFTGDMSGRSVFKHQPVKLAALEAHWDTNKDEGASFTAFAIPDARSEKNRFEISIPNGLSLLATHSLHGTVMGLKEIPREKRPYVPLLFLSFRIMIAIGLLYFLIMIWALYLWKKRKLFDQPTFLRTLLIAHPLGFLAIEAGWINTEVGRQPWLVYNMMRTAEGVSPVAAGNVVWSLSLFLIIFAAIGSIYSYYVMQMISRGPDLESPVPAIQRPAGMIFLGERE